MPFLSADQALEVFKIYIKNQSEIAPGWDVGDMLSLSSTEIWQDHKVADPAVWEDWKEIVSEVVGPVDEGVDSGLKINQQQALKAMCYFLEKKYSNEETLLADVSRDLDILDDPLEVKKIWQECV